MTGVVNPTSFTITDPSFATEKVTGFNISFGQTSGGPYSLTAAVPTADIDVTAGSATGKIADLNEKLADGQWFAVAAAVNAAGTGPASAEQPFEIQSAPVTAPTFTLA